MRLVNLFDCECLLRLPAAVKLRSTVNGGSPREVSEKQKKSNDQRAPVTRYEVLLSDRRTFICY